MSYGIRAVNSNSGSMQIDSESKNLVFKEKQVITSTAYQEPGFGSAHSGASWAILVLPTYLYNLPVVAVAAGVGLAVQAYDRVFDGFFYNWQITVLVNAAAGTNVTFYIFDDLVDTAPSSGFGFWVKDGTSRVTFSSAQANYAQIAGATGGSDFVTTPPSGTFTSGRTYAFLASNVSYKKSASNNNLVYPAVSFSSGVLQVSNVEFWRRSSAPTFTYPAYNLIVFDVTGL